eukprot:scaffold145569_cov133-Phaeocystis_antarctica.AAC.2
MRVLEEIDPLGVGIADDGGGRLAVVLEASQVHRGCAGEVVRIRGLQEAVAVLAVGVALDVAIVVTPFDLHIGGITRQFEGARGQAKLIHPPSVRVVQVHLADDLGRNGVERLEGFAVERARGQRRGTQNLEERPLRHVENQLRSHRLRAIAESQLLVGRYGGLRDRLELVVREPTRARVDEATHHLLDECGEASLAVRPLRGRDVELGARNIARIVAMHGQLQATQRHDASTDATGHLEDADRRGVNCLCVYQAQCRVQTARSGTCAHASSSVVSMWHYNVHVGGGVSLRTDDRHLATGRLFLRRREGGKVRWADLDAIADRPYTSRVPRGETRWCPRWPVQRSAPVSRKALPVAQLSLAAWMRRAASARKARRRWTPGRR